MGKPFPDAEQITADQTVWDVAIVGGGFSGAVVAIHALAATARPSRVLVFEARETIGLGIAYSTQNDRHLMNVPTGRLSCLADRPDDFLAWCRESGRSDDADGFMPRHVFGAYVQSRLASASRGSMLHHVRQSVAAISQRDDLVEVRAADGSTWRARHVVLATGHGPTRLPAALQAARHLPNVLPSPWDQSRLDQLVSRAERILLIGTGLTMCDTVVSLVDAGFDGEVIAVSRHGLLPAGHAAPPSASPDVPTMTAAAHGLGPLFRTMRKSMAGRDWRAVMDAMRPQFQAIWQALPRGDQQRFIARLATYWDIHRHRMPPATREVLMARIDSGRLRIVAGHVKAITPEGDRLRVGLKYRGAGTSRTVDVGGVVLCTGPEANPVRWGSPVIDGLLASGDVSLDHLGLGLRCDAAGASIGSDGRTRGWLSMLGPLRRGELWESTAVREIVEQASVIGAGLRSEGCPAPAAR